MEQNIESKLEFKNILTNFYSFNKKKIFSFIFILIIIVISIFFIEHNKNKKNILIAEKYIQAGVYLSLQKKDNAKILYEEIILSKNEFYSTLSLNIILEKNLISDKNKILNYFETLENIVSDKNNADLITLKKALFLIKESNVQNGKDLLNNLIKENSNLKKIAKEILKK